MFLKCFLKLRLKARHLFFCLVSISRKACQIKQQIFPRPHDSGNIRFATI